MCFECEVKTAWALDKALSPLYLSFVSFDHQSLSFLSLKMALQRVEIIVREVYVSGGSEVTQCLFRTTARALLG